LNLGEARSFAAKKLGSAGIERPWFEADILLSFVTGYDRARIHREPGTTLSEDIFLRLLESVERRSAREPLQYITGSCMFMDVFFSVGPGCLIPRPETELLVLESRSRFRGGVFVDWGTGSGCLAASIMIEKRHSRCIAIEREPLALSWAWRNLRALGLLERCLLWHSKDIEDVPLPSCGVEMIVANPPYIPSGVVKDLMPEVSGYEPHTALDGGHDGFVPYRQIVPWAARSLKPGGCAILEVGNSGQAEEVERILPRSLMLESVVPDLQGITRVVVLKRVPF